MKYCFILFCTILLWNVAQPRTLKQLSDEPSYWYMVEIESGAEKICDGTIIDQEWILTAAHCIHELNAKDLSVRYSNSVSGMYGRQVAVAEKVVHPKYDPETKAYDVALLKLGQKLDSDADVEVVKLSEPGFNLTEDASALFPGWGANQDVSDPCKYLHGSETKIIHCGDSSLEHDVICASASNCPQGGGGGPLIVDGKQVGIATSVSDCNHLIFTPVSHPEIKGFIQKTIGV